MSAAYGASVDPAFGPGVTPYFQILDLSGTRSFRNTFATPPVPAGDQTAVLLFACPNTWEMGGAAATVGGGASANTGGIPSPSGTDVPEPTSLGLMILAGLCFARRRRAA